LGELVTLGSGFSRRPHHADLGDLFDGELGTDLFQCGTCLTFNSTQLSKCSNCGKLKPKDFWDLSALSLTHEIEPIGRHNKTSTITIIAKGPALQSGRHSHAPSLSRPSSGHKLARPNSGSSHQSLSPAKPSEFENMMLSGSADYVFNDERSRIVGNRFVASRVSSELPKTEQSLRLLGLSGLHSLSVDWGRVVHISNGLIVVNVFSECGASGGPAVDRQGRLVGVLSCAQRTMSMAYIEPIGNFIKLLQRHEFIGNRHDPSRCTYCAVNPKMKEKFSCNSHN
jgi:hypothetical protein